MKQVAAILDRNLKQRDFGITQKPELKPQPDAVTSRLFAKFALLYGHKWVSIYPDQDVLFEAEKAWGEALAGFTLDDIKRGIDKAIDQHPSWPPTVGEFKKLCQFDCSELGLPSLDQAWFEASSTDPRAKYSHGIVLAARNDGRCDAYTWRLLPTGKGMKLFEPIYTDYVNRFKAGEAFDLPIMIEDKVGRPVTKSERAVAHKQWFGELKGAIAK